MKENAPIEPISSKARSCPSCGLPLRPGTIGRVTKVLIVSIVVIGIYGVAMFFTGSGTNRLVIAGLLLFTATVWEYVQRETP